MGCLVNMFKIVLGLFLIIFMLVVGFKLVFDPYRPESPNSCWSHKSAEMDSKQNEPSFDNISYDVPMQTGTTHDYIMANTFQNHFVRMELDPELERSRICHKSFQNSLRTGLLSYNHFGSRFIQYA